MRKNVERKELSKAREDFEAAARQVSVEAVASYLGLQRSGKLYKHPLERTGSLKLYPESNSFFDFGRSVGGDSVKLWSHVRGCDSWTALKEIRSAFGLSAPDKQRSRDLIRKQEEARQRQLEAKKQEKKRWRMEVDTLKSECQLYQAILDSEHCKPLSWTWCTCQNRLTATKGMLDLLCGIY